jgi:hypothetical protein
MDQSERGTSSGYEVEMNRSDGAWANAWCPVWETNRARVSSAEAERSGPLEADFAWADRSDVTVTPGGRR